MTSLEQAILEILHDRYAEFGFPEPAKILCTGRRNRGTVHYVDLEHLGEINTPDGVLALGAYSHVEFASLPNGAFVEVTIEDRKLKQIGFVVIGDAAWDGDQSGWKVTGEANE